jgi:segregation and condensation protein B
VPSAATAGVDPGVGDAGTAGPLLGADGIEAPEAGQPGPAPADVHVDASPERRDAETADPGAAGSTEPTATTAPFLADPSGDGSQTVFPGAGPATEGEPDPGMPAAEAALSAGQPDGASSAEPLTAGPPADHESSSATLADSDPLPGPTPADLDSSPAPADLDSSPAPAGDSPAGEPLPSGPSPADREIGRDVPGPAGEAAGVAGGGQPIPATADGSGMGEESLFGADLMVADASLDEPERLRATLEAVLLVVDTPTSAVLLAQVLGQPVGVVEQALRYLRDEYDAARRGLDLREVAGGWRLYTREDFAVHVERFVLEGQQTRLTQAALETLAVIAYRQPITRSRVSAIRGVNVDAVMRTLLSRGLVEECGSDAETGGGLYRTTQLFLERLGISSLEELPSLAPLLPDTSQLDDVALST